MQHYIYGFRLLFLDFRMAIKKVSLIGATGNIGSVLLEALVSSGDFDVTVVQRKSSKSKPSVGGAPVTVKTVDDGMSTASLQEAFQGRDAVVVAFPLGDLQAHIRIAEAAAAAGVSRIIPADYGGSDSSSARPQELVPLFRNKTIVRERIQELTAQNPKFSWTSIVNGAFFDWGLREKFLHFDLQAKTADILDGGEIRCSMSTLARVAEAVVKVLQQADDERTRNRMLFVQSFCVTQNNVLEALRGATPGAEWKVKEWNTEDFIKEHTEKVAAGHPEAIEDVVFALGILDSNWEGRDDFAMDLLGLQNEDLKTVVEQVVKSQK